MAAAESIEAILPNSFSDDEGAELLDDLILALQHGSHAVRGLSALRDRSAFSDRIGDGSATRLDWQPTRGCTLPGPRGYNVSYCLTSGISRLDRRLTG